MNNTNVNITLSIPKEIAAFLVLDEDQNELQRNAMLLYKYNVWAFYFKRD